MIVNENVIFRLIKTPCCGSLQCHVNHRLPNYCSECGRLIHLELLHGDCILVTDRDAWLKYNVPATAKEIANVDADKS